MGSTPGGCNSLGGRGLGGYKILGRYKSLEGTRVCEGAGVWEGTRTLEGQGSGSRRGLLDMGLRWGRSLGGTGAMKEK